MLTREKRAAFNTIMSGYTSSPNFDVESRGEDLTGFEEFDDRYAEAGPPMPNCSCGAAPYDFDDEDFANDYGLPAMSNPPIQPFSEDDLRFLRDFVLGTAMYVEQLEAIASEQSDEFWQARENAYRIVTAILIRHYEYELEG